MYIQIVYIEGSKATEYNSRAEVYFLDKSFYLAPYRMIFQVEVYMGVRRAIENT